METSTHTAPPVDLDRLVSRYLRGSHDCRESALERMISDLWRNYPEWPSTFGPCSEKCGGSGRGSGPCASCVERAIGKLVGDDLAACGLRRHIVDARAEARKLRDMVSSANVESIHPESKPQDYE
jgi:hypothetical protein